MTANPSTSSAARLRSAPLQDAAIELVCLGRAGVDFYARHVGSRLEDAGSFAKYIGGSSTNIACCSARMGLRTALITRVGDEHMGGFIREQLCREGVDVRNVVTDPDRLTALVILGIKDDNTFPLIFYRENCADMAIEPADLDHGLISDSKALLITGTHFSSPGVYAASTAALAVAREAGTRTVLDIDYRPVLWGLTGRGDGETRFIADQGVSAHLQGILPLFDLIVGTEEEVHIAGGSTDTLTALRQIRAISNAVIVLKRGPLGASVYDADIPDDLDDGITVTGVSVDVLNVLGAGDAFISGFLRGWLRDEGYQQALTYANACGALVVSRHGCTPAMPTLPELDYYLANSAAIVRPDLDPELNYLHRVTTQVGEWPCLMVHAFDHRSQMQQMAEAAACEDAPARIGALKHLLYQATLQVSKEDDLAGQAGMLCDAEYGQAVLNDATASGLWLARPVELPGSRPLRFAGGRSAGTLLQDVPLNQVIKCLVFYSTEDPEALREQQESRLHELYDACCDSGHELLLEIIPPDESLSSGESVCRSVSRLLDLGIRADWWKVPALSREHAGVLDSLIRERSPWCRGVVILGLDAPLQEVADGFAELSGLPMMKGFAVGRSIFGDAARAWLAGQIDDQTLMQQVAANYRQVIAAWQNPAQLP